MTTTPENIDAITAAEAATLDQERLQIPERTAFWRANYRFRMAYLRMAIAAGWWKADFDQIREMHRLAEERFPDPTNPRNWPKRSEPSPPTPLDAQP